MDFKNRIKALRIEKGLTQTDLASQFNKTESAARAWELGRTKPDADTLVALAEYFNCTTDYLLGISDDRNPAEQKSREKKKSELNKLIEEMSVADRTLFIEIVCKTLNTALNESPHIDSYAGFSTSPGIYSLCQLLTAFEAVVRSANELSQLKPTNTYSYMEYLRSARSLIRQSEDITNSMPRSAYNKMLERHNTTTDPDEKILWERFFDANGMFRTSDGVFNPNPQR